jgi:hypothetical protein
LEGRDGGVSIVGGSSELSSSKNYETRSIADEEAAAAAMIGWLDVSHCFGAYRGLPRPQKNNGFHVHLFFLNLPEVSHAFP